MQIYNSLKNNCEQHHYNGLFTAIIVSFQRVHKKNS